MKKIIIGLLVICMLPFAYADLIWYEDNGTEVLADSRVLEDAPSTNFGNELVLGHRVTGGGPSNGRLSYMTFINTIPAGSTINNASFHWYSHFFEAGTGAPRIYDVYTNGSVHWGELLITWNNAPCRTGAGPLENASHCNTTHEDTAATGTGNKTFQVTNAVQRAVDHNQDNFTFVIRSFGSINLESQVRSRDATPGAGEIIPTLFVDFTPPPSTIPPNITLLFPLDQTLLNNDPLDVNYTVTEGTNSVTTINLYINNSLNSTTSSGNFSIDIGEGDFDIFVEAIDNQSLGDNSSTVSIRIDRTNPISDLTSIITPGVTLETAQSFTITATDSSLFGHNVTVFDPNGDIFFSQEDLNISGTTNQITFFIDLNQSTIQGTYTVISNQSDDHTKNRIKEYETSHNKAERKLRFQGDNDVQVIMKQAQKHVGKSMIEKKHTLYSLGHTKKEDRYEFEFNMPEQGTYTYTFDLIADNKLTARDDSEYSCHFVIDDTQWIDFEPYTCTYEQYSDTYASVTVTTNENVQFKSIGGTNIGTDESTFVVTIPQTLKLECDYASSSGVFDCATTAEQGFILEQPEVQCTNVTNSSFVLIQDATQIADVESNSFLTNFSNVLTFRSPNINHTLNGSTYNLTAFCNNLVGTEQISSVFTPSAASTPSATTDEFSFITVAGGTLLTAAILVIIGCSIFLSFRRRR